ncbi:Zinc finger protein 131 [Anthophora quadrimaculata]
MPLCVDLKNSLVSVVDYENFRSVYPNVASLNVVQNEEYFHFEEINSSKEESSLKLHRTAQTDTEEIDNSFVDVRNMEETVHTTDTLLDHHFSENIFIKKENKHEKISHKRKQKLSFLNTWHDLPNWNISSFTDDKKEVLGENIFHRSTRLEVSTERRKIKQCNKNQVKKQGISVLRNKQKENPLLPMSHSVSTDFNSECQTLPSLADTESKHLQDSIDFSSNEIFNQFNYEFYDNISLDRFTWHLTDFDETYTSLSTTYDNDTYGKAYDINVNEIDLYETTTHRSLTQNKQNKENISMKQSLMFSEYQDEDILTNDTNFKCSCGSCCDFNDSASSWIINNGVHTFTKDKLLAETLNENAQIQIKNLHLNITKSSEDLINDTLNNLNSEKTHSSLTDTESLLQYADHIDSPLIEFASYSNAKDKDTEIYTEATCTQENQEFNVISNSSEETNSNEILEMFKNETRNLHDTDVTQAEGNKVCNRNKKKFQCLLCSLTFLNSRTMAMHRAAAHGGKCKISSAVKLRYLSLDFFSGIYTILCETCGRLFNRKYHFSRHFVDCGRSKESFKCDVCMKKYRHKSSLVHHLKTAHRDHCTRNDSMKFTCNVCKKVYSKFGCFENHIKKHKSIW